MSSSPSQNTMIVPWSSAGNFNFYNLLCYNIYNFVNISFSIRNQKQFHVKKNKGCIRTFLLGRIFHYLTWWRRLVRYRVDGRFDETTILEKAAPHGQAGLQAPGPVLVSVRTAGGAATKHWGFLERKGWNILVVRRNKNRRWIID